MPTADPIAHLMARASTRAGARMRAAPRRLDLRLVLLAAVLVLSPWARAVELAPNAPETYTVRQGDTLWSIAGRFLRDPWRWREVWRSNSDIANPNKIYPGDRLRLTMVGGEPRISVDRGGERQVGYSGDMRVVKLSPRVRVTPLKKEIPTIPIASVAPFLTQPYVADSDAIKNAPYVVGFPDEHIVAGLGDSIYVRSIQDTAVQRFQVLRPGEPYRDPDTNALLGYEAAFVANADLERVGDPAKLSIARVEREVAIGDRVIPASLDEPLTNFFPKPAPAGLRGRIIAVLGGVSQVGLYDVVVINKGTEDKVSIGDVFEVYRGGTKARDQVRQGGFTHNWRDESPLDKEFWYGQDSKVQGFLHDEPIPPTVHVSKPRSTYVKPFERSGILMVFRTFERVSFALVLDADRTMRIRDRIGPPQS